MKRELPKALREKQERAKKDTEKKIEDAIKLLKDLGYENITLSQIMKETNLSRSTLNKQHAQDIFKKNGIGKYKTIKSIRDEYKAENDKVIIDKLEKQLSIANAEVLKLKAELKDTNRTLKEVKLEAVEAKQRLKETVGKFQAMYEKVIALGIEIII